MLFSPQRFEPCHPNQIDTVYTLNIVELYVYKSSLKINYLKIGIFFKFLMWYYIIASWYFRVCVEDKLTL